MKAKILSFLLVLFVIGLLFVIGISQKNLGTPNEVYQVYLNGRKIGLIDSEQKLLDLIDKGQAGIKESFNVDKVYPPTGLNIEKVITYDNNLSDTETVYNAIKEEEPFTVSGYVVTIYYQKIDDVDKSPLVAKCERICRTQRKCK